MARFGRRGREERRTSQEREQEYGTGQERREAEADPGTGRSLMQPAPVMGRWMEEIFNELDPWMGMRRMLPRPALRGEGLQIPRADIIDAGDRYEVTAEVPGVHKEDVHIDATDGRLEIRAETETRQEEEQKEYYHREIGRRAFYRSFPMPDDADVDQAEASLEEGLLKIHIPKQEIQEERRTIEIR